MLRHTGFDRTIQQASSLHISPNYNTNRCRNVASIEPASRSPANASLSSSTTSSGISMPYRRTYIVAEFFVILNTLLQRSSFWTLNIIRTTCDKKLQTPVGLLHGANYAQNHPAELPSTFHLERTRSTEGRSTPLLRSRTASSRGDAPTLSCMYLHIGVEIFQATGRTDGHKDARTFRPAAINCHRLCANACAHVHVRVFFP